MRENNNSPNLWIMAGIFAAGLFFGFSFSNQNKPSSSQSNENDLLYDLYDCQEKIKNANYEIESANNVIHNIEYADGCDELIEVIGELHQINLIDEY